MLRCVMPMLLLAACCPPPRQPAAPDYPALLHLVGQQVDAFSASLPEQGPARCPWQPRRALLSVDGHLVKVWLSAPDAPDDVAELLLRDDGSGNFRGELAARMPVTDAGAGKPLPRPVTTVIVPRTVLLGAKP